VSCPDQELGACVLGSPYLPACRMQGGSPSTVGLSGPSPGHVPSVPKSLNLYELAYPYGVLSRAAVVATEEALRGGSGVMVDGDEQMMREMMARPRSGADDRQRNLARLVFITVRLFLVLSRCV